MIKTFSLLLLVAALSAFSASAKTLKVPSDEFAIASIDIPDDWEPEEITNGVAGNSPDEAVYLAVVAVGSEKGMSAEIDDTFAMLKEHDVTLDEASKKENKFKINDLEAEEMLYQGKDQDGPTAVSITFVTIKDKIIVLTYWVSTEDEKKHQEEVGKIVQSLKPAS
ncbi:MAG TPA: PsbP-related protein [Chthoniobacterales bacterium]|nr:PsbP-related protein [Chthoniobacterales bacterium]